MIKQFTHGDLTWIDLDSPTPAEIRDIMGQYAIHPEVAEELTRPSVKPRISVYPNYFYAILNFPALKHSHAKGANIQEIDFVVGKDVIITSHYDSIDSLHKFAKHFEVNSVLGKNPGEAHGGVLFFALIRHIYASLEDEIDALKDKLSHIENRLFEGEERKVLYSISEISRDLLDFRQALSHHQPVLEELAESGADLFDEDYAAKIEMLRHEHHKLESTLDRLGEILLELRETNNALLTTRQNEIVKVFTILAFLTFPVTLLVDILTIDSPSNPINHLEHHFWFIVFIVVVIVGVMYAWFKKKKWL